MKLLDDKIILLVGLLLLLKAAVLTAFSLRLGLLFAALIPAVLLALLLLRLALRSHQDKVTTGTAGMVGMTGRAESELTPEGTVFVHGELWRARAILPVRAGENVRITGVDGLLLEVEPADKDTVMRRRQFAALDQKQLSGENSHG